MTRQLVKDSQFKLAIAAFPLTKAEKQEIKENWDVSFETKMVYDENDRPVGKGTYVYFDYPASMVDETIEEINEYLAL